MEVKFYKCETCGNVALKVVDEGPTLVCCGNPMVELATNLDGAPEKHIPSVQIEGSTVDVQIGAELHPELEVHHIMFICLVTEKGYQIVPIEAGIAPRAVFTVNPEDTPLKVYEYCNVHGLWVADI